MQNDCESCIDTSEAPLKCSEYEKWGLKLQNQKNSQELKNCFENNLTQESIDLKKIDTSNLKSQIEGFLISNNGEGIIINEKITKGVLLRGYKKEEFQSLRNKTLGLWCFHVTLGW